MSSFPGMPRSTGGSAKSPPTGGSTTPPPPILGPPIPPPPILPAAATVEWSPAYPPAKAIDDNLRNSLRLNPFVFMMILLEVVVDSGRIVLRPPSLTKGCEGEGRPHGGPLQVSRRRNCGDYGETTYGRIISLSSCSTMWQCQTYSPAMSNVALTRVISPGYAITVSLYPASQGSGARIPPAPSRLTTWNRTRCRWIGWASTVKL